MTRTRSLVAAFLVVIASPSLARAANTVSWGVGQPTVVLMMGMYNIHGSGTFNADAGWTVLSGQMTAIPTGGGMARTGNIPIGAGVWGVAAITGVPSGQYSVTALLVFKNMATGERVFIYSPQAIVNVP